MLESFLNLQQWSVEFKWSCSNLPSYAKIFPLITSWNITPYNAFYFTGSPTKTGGLQASIPPIDKVCTQFSRIIYLGAAMVNQPKNESEATHKMAILKGQQSQNAIEIVLSVPRTSEGCCR